MGVSAVFRKQEKSLMEFGLIRSSLGKERIAVFRALGDFANCDIDMKTLLETVGATKFEFFAKLAGQKMARRSRRR
jgi:hypothetical protein